MQVSNLTSFYFPTQHRYYRKTRSRQNERCIWNKFSDQKYTAILIFFPWKKTAGASLAPVTEALAGLQTRDTLKSTAHSFDRLFVFTPAPNTQSFTICCRLLPVATTWCPHVFSFCFPMQIYKDLPFQTTCSSLTTPSPSWNGVCCWLSNTTPHVHISFLLHKILHRILWFYWHVP